MHGVKDRYQLVFNPFRTTLTVLVQVAPVLFDDLFDFFQQLDGFQNDIALSLAATAAATIGAGGGGVVSFEGVEDAALGGVVVCQFLFFEAVLALLGSICGFFMGEEGAHGR